MDTKDLIKAKLDIVEIIGNYVTVRKAGANYKALCPFHHEKSPSFMVSQERQIFHCFGCGEGGDVIAFIQKIEHCDFIEALKFLAPKAGVKIDTLITHDKQYSKKERLIEINERAAKFYHQLLLQMNQAVAAREYLKKRGLTELSVDSWLLGYAPEGWDTLLSALKGKGYVESEILEAGLAIKNEKGKVYDRFRQRIMFPIRDAQGHVVGFTARQLHAEQTGGKYINSPQTLIYNKSEVLFGLDQAKGEIKKVDSVILVEGNMDVIMSHQAGVKNVVAVSGTALTELQISLLKRFTHNLSFCFDADAAGMLASMRGVDVALSQEMSIKAIVLPAKVGDVQVKDPADLVAVQPEAWAVAIRSAIPMMQSIIETTLRTDNIQTDSGKRKATGALVSQLQKITNPIERQHWQAMIAQRLGVSEAILSEVIAKSNKSRNNLKTAAEKAPNAVKKSRTDLLLENMYCLLLKDPRNISYAVDQFKLELAAGSQMLELVRRLFLFYNQGQPFSYANFAASLEEDPAISAHNTLMALRADAHFADFSEPQIREELVHTIKYLQQNSAKQELARLQAELTEAERRGDQARIQEIMRLSASCSELLNN